MRGFFWVLLGVVSLFVLACGSSSVEPARPDTGTHAPVAEPAGGSGSRSAPESAEESSSATEPESAPEAEPAPEPEPGLALPPAHDQLALGAAFSCAADHAERVWCWGSNRFGQIGDPAVDRGTSGRATRPRRLAGLRARHIAAGAFHACVARPDGSVACWGHGGYGQLGRGDRADGEAPGPVLTAAGTPLRGAVAVAAGRAFSCALLRDGEVACWGTNDRRQLGLTAALEGTERAPRAGGATMDSAARTGRWAVRTLGSGSGSGSGSESESASESESESGEPPLRALFATRVPGITGAVAIAAGRAHACVLVADARVRCWGEALDAQLGRVSESSGPSDVRGRARRGRPTEPLRLANISSTTLGAMASPALDLLSLGGAHSCVRDGDDVRCWGRNASLELGPGPRGPRRRFAPRDSPAGVTAVAAGSRHTCLLTEGGGVHCAGDGRSGQIGNGRRRRARRWTQVELGGRARVLASGLMHVCAWMNGGGLRCWGSGKRGQVGPHSVDADGDLENAVAPVNLSLPGYTPPRSADDRDQPSAESPSPSTNVESNED